MLFSLIENLEDFDIILASASPRRYELLKSIGLPFRVVSGNVEEVFSDEYSPQELVELNAEKKGAAASEKYPNSLVISADTIVALDDIIMGKPRDEKDAYDMLSRLSGRTHQVYTSFVLNCFSKRKKYTETVITDVHFRNLREEEIRSYINTGEMVDKAGAYAIQGQGALLVEKINGDFFNVVGFPISKFFAALKMFLKE
jgi:septum formation protein